jgi:hypothetical protein
MHKTAVVLLLVVLVTILLVTSADQNQQRSCVKQCLSQMDSDKLVFKKLCRQQCAKKRIEKHPHSEDKEPRRPHTLPVEEKKPATVQEAVDFPQVVAEDLAQHHEEEPVKGSWVRNFVHSFLRRVAPLSDAEAEACPRIDCDVECNGGLYDVIVVNGCRMCRCLAGKPSPTPAPEPTVQETVVPEPTPQVTVVPQPTPQPTFVPEPTQPTPQPTIVPEPTPQETVFPEPTIVPQPTPQVTVFPEPTIIPQPTPQETVFPEPTIVPQPTVQETVVPEPTPSPSHHHLVCHLPKKGCSIHEWKLYLCCLVKKLKERFCHRKRPHHNIRLPIFGRPFRLFDDKDDLQFVSDMLSEMSYGVEISSDMAENFLAQVKARFEDRDADAMSDEAEEEADLSIFEMVRTKHGKYSITKQGPKRIFEEESDKSWEAKLSKYFETKSDRSPLLETANKRARVTAHPLFVEGVRGHQKYTRFIREEIQSDKNDLDEFFDWVEKAQKIYEIIKEEKKVDAEVKSDIYTPKKILQ